MQPLSRGLHKCLCTHQRAVEAPLGEQKRTRSGHLNAQAEITAVWERQRRPKEGGVKKKRHSRNLGVERLESTCGTQHSRGLSMLLTLPSPTAFKSNSWNLMEKCSFGCLKCSSFIRYILAMGKNSLHFQ